jgi:catechol 2,3-dioxygenase-like lactoylglutathione lyase family enzyme
MLKIGRLWHVNHIVRDYRNVADWYRRVFGARDIFVDDWLEVEQRWASMVTIGDLAIDVMEPTAEAAELPLGRFLSRFEEHYQAVAYFVSSPPVEIFDALVEGGVRCYSFAGGGRETLADKPKVPIFTHPKDTAGQIEFMPFVQTRPGPLGVPGEWEDPRYAPGWSTDSWRDQHPLAIEGWRVAVVVRDLAKAERVYEALGATRAHEEESAGARRAWFRLGENTRVELVEPTRADSVAARDLERNGEIFHSCVFEVRDLEAAAAHLESQGVAIAEHHPDRIVADPESCHGAVFDFTTGRVPVVGER